MKPISEKPTTGATGAFYQSTSNDIPSPFDPGNIGFLIYPELDTDDKRTAFLNELHAYRDNLIAWSSAHPGHEAVVGIMLSEMRIAEEKMASSPEAAKAYLCNHGGEFRGVYQYALMLNSPDGPPETSAGGFDFILDNMQGMDPQSLAQLIDDVRSDFLTQQSGNKGTAQYAETLSALQLLQEIAPLMDIISSDELVNILNQERDRLINLPSPYTPSFALVDYLVKLAPVSGDMAARFQDVINDYISQLDEMLNKGTYFSCPLPNNFNKEWAKAGEEDLKNALNVQPFNQAIFIHYTIQARNALEGLFPH